MKKHILFLIKWIDSIQELGAQQNPLLSGILILM